MTCSWSVVDVLSTTRMFRKEWCGRPSLRFWSKAGDGRRTVALFNMRCDGQQIPEQLDGTKPRMYRGRATFTGKAAPWNDGSPGAAAPASAEGRAAVGVPADGRVFGILTPDLEANACVWFTLPLRGLRIIEHGQQGLLKKRPVSVQFGNEDWSVRFSDINVIIPASGGRQQTGQEATFAAGPAGLALARGI